ncbi:hypothetical protein ACETK8_00210 [Brevundimonas staleyi]|uniref:Homeodomain-like domain-containing protein n=1 Tax=Brevundimonas staleyi TaxID=74326 RepID=A0ABW0FVI2_9CAUL
MTQTQSTEPPVEIWLKIRDAYRAGATAPVLAERYGISLRTLRRRIAQFEWRRQDDVLERRRAAARAVGDEMLEVMSDEGAEEFGLLFEPRPHILRRFAFRKASEEAAMGRPQQSLAWIRVLERMDRCGDRAEAEGELFRDVDHLRAAYLRRLDALGDTPPPSTS